METSAVTNSQGSQNLVTAATTSQLGRDAFLKLLITELQNQDPMSPMQDKDFIAQLAQFSSLEQMQKLSSGMDDIGKSQAATRALEMVGMQIDYVDVDAGGPVSGAVTGVVFEDGWAILEVGSKQVQLADVISVHR